MPSFAIGGFVVLHGLITAMIGVGSIAAPNPPAMTLPSWFNWWPGSLGRSWLLDGLNLGTGGAVAGGVIWLVAGAALVAAGLGFLGAPLVREQWPLFAVAGASIGLVALTVYFHPIYLLAIGIDIALILLLWERVGATVQ
jgi:hypothetical protein